MSNSLRSSCLIAGISWLAFVGGCGNEESRVPIPNGNASSVSSNSKDRPGSQPSSNPVPQPATQTGKGSISPTAKGRQLLQKKEYKAALSEMKTRLAKHPKDVDGRLVRTYALMGLNRISDADVVSLDLFREHPGDGRVVVARA
jgi:hypothetical protein